MYNFRVTRKYTQLAYPKMFGELHLEKSCGINSIITMETLTVEKASADLASVVNRALGGHPVRIQADGGEVGGETGETGDREGIG